MTASTANDKSACLFVLFSIHTQLTRMLRSLARQIASNRYAPHLSSCMGIGTGTRRAANRSNAKAKLVFLLMKSLLCSQNISEFLPMQADQNLLMLAPKMVLCQTVPPQVLLRAKERPRTNALVSQSTAAILSDSLIIIPRCVDEAEFNMKRKRVSSNDLNRVSYRLNVLHNSPDPRKFRLSIINPKNRRHRVGFEFI